MKKKRSEAGTDEQRLEGLCQELLAASRQWGTLADMPVILAKIDAELKRQVWWFRNDKGILEDRKFTLIEEDTSSCPHTF